MNAVSSVLKSATACPVDYRYSASVFRRAPSLVADTVYVVGGLYGNVEALHEILRMQEAEARAGRRVELVFNGDHNWFDVDAASFREINEAALAGTSIRGNVEAEIAQPSDGGCGCNYPDYVNAEYVARSNAIMRRLQRTAAEFSDIRQRLGALPMTRTIEVGGERVGIVHGDAELLSGWSFAAESLSPNGRSCSGDEATAELTPRETIDRIFRDADVTAFASSHTCLPHARDYGVDGRPRLLMNNGSSGIPNFTGAPFGIVTRISSDPTVPADSLYGITVRGARFDAVPVRFDQRKWLGRFLANWQPGSPGYEAYYKRLVGGPAFELADAIGGLVARVAG